MKNRSTFLAPLLLAVVALSSCSRTDYTFQATTPAASSPVVAVTSPAAEMSATVATTKIASATAAPQALATTVAPAAAPVAEAAPARVAETASVQAANAQVSAASARAAKPTFVQRLVLKKALNQVAKAQSNKQNTASVTKTAAHSGSLTITLVGLIALLVGIIISSGFLITVGSIVVVVGLILLLLKAL